MPDSCRIEFSDAALQRLEALSSAEKTRLEEMLREIGAAVAADGFGAGRAPLTPAPSVQELLSLQVGRATVRYSVDAVQRLLTVKHVLVPRPVPFTVIWSELAGTQMAAIHPEIREHIVKQIAQVALLAAGEARVASVYRGSPPRELAWSFEGHTVCYTIEDRRFTLTVVQVLGPGVRSAG